MPEQARPLQRAQLLAALSLGTEISLLRPAARRFGLGGDFDNALAVMMVAAWIFTIGLRRLAARFKLLRYVWHPALFVFAVYMIVLSSIVLVAAG